MRRSVFTLLAFAGVVLASEAVFSVHDDLLAFPQYKVVFSHGFMSDIEAYDVLAHDVAAHAGDSTYETEPPSESTSISSQRNPGHNSLPEDIGGRNSYEWIYQDGNRYLCSIPIIEKPPRNETSEAEARAEEAQELAKATDRGWELLQDLDGPCLYFMSGYWSYSFCRNSEVRQFRQLPQQQGKPAYPPLEDPSVNSFILGKAMDDTKPESQSRQDEWGNEVDVRKLPKTSPPTTELQMEGDTRYLVQKLDGGTLCDLTGKPRRVEVQYHCNPHAHDHISRLKETTTCAYLLDIHTPRLCKDIAFVPPTATEAHGIVCQRVVSQEEMAKLDLSTLDGTQELAKDNDKEKEKQIVIGGTVVGGKNHVGKEGQKLALPGLTLENPATDILAKASGEADGAQILVLSDEALVELELEPQLVQELRERMKRMAGDRGWTLELVDGPGNVKEIQGVVDGEDEDSDEVDKQPNDADNEDRKEKPAKDEL